MFKFFKEKIKSWASKISKDKKEETKEIEEKSGKRAKKLKKEKKIQIPEEVEGEEGKSFFQKIGEKISKIRISDKEFEIYSEELKMLLLENNVAFHVAEKIIGDLKKKIVNQEFLKKEVEEQIKEALKDIIEDILIEPFDVVKKIMEKKEKKNEPYVILFCGINGSGKTTTIAKIAEHLKKRYVSVVLAAGDTFRAASIEQLQKHGERIGVKVISHDYGSDPASIGFDAINYAKKNNVEAVLIDTAGRMHTAKNLLREMEKITRVCKPDLKIFIGESITGNDAVQQAEAFNEAIGIDAIVLTKADIDEKGGTSLSIGYVLRKPILFLGTGQEYDKIEVFDKKKFVERLGL
ncbi:signal recognition particle-docking protein FtsY [Candidatus Pacearchaeota archaeon]|nr:signal recognition particle-docking protein FtsY [Candidatus Pacearchaeota archaeon]